MNIVERVAREIVAGLASDEMVPDEPLPLGDADVTPTVDLYDGAEARARQAVAALAAGARVGLDSADTLRAFLRLWGGPVAFRCCPSGRVLDRAAVEAILAAGADVFDLEKYTG